MLKIGTIIILLVILSPTILEAGYDQAVKEAQQILNQLGYKPGPIDGYWGKKTLGAVKAYQRDQGISETGKLDTSTLDRLGIKIESTTLLVQEEKGNSLVGVQVTNSDFAVSILARIISSSINFAFSNLLREENHNYLLKNVLAKNSYGSTTLYVKTGQNRYTPAYYAGLGHHIKVELSSEDSSLLKSLDVTIGDVSGQPLDALPTVMDSEKGIFHFLVPAKNSSSNLTILITGVSPKFPSIPFELGPE